MSRKRSSRTGSHTSERKAEQQARRLEETKKRNGVAWKTASDTPADQLVNHVMCRGADSLAKEGHPWQTIRGAGGITRVQARIRGWRIHIETRCAASRGDIRVEHTEEDGTNLCWTLGIGADECLVTKGGRQDTEGENDGETQDEAVRMLREGLFRIAFAGGLSALARITETMPRSTQAVMLICAGEEGKLNRMPAIGDLATIAPVEAIEVDGEPVASGAPRSVLAGRRPKAWRPRQGRLFGHLERIGGCEIGDAVITALRNWPIDDLRSRRIGDVYRLASLVFAAARGMHGITPRDGAIFLTGQDTPANRKRWYEACESADGLLLIVNPRTGQPLKLLVADWDLAGNTTLWPPVWWDGKTRHRLSGALWRDLRLRTGSTDAHTGGSGIERTLAGLEAMLSYAPTAGRGQHARTSNHLVPIRPGGPGPNVYVSWRDVLRLSGEHTPADEAPNGAASRRYRRRVAHLRQLKYEVPAGANAAPAGDTIEIIRQVKGGRSHEAGIVIRASARFAEAVTGTRRVVRIPASKLLPGKA